LSKALRTDFWRAASLNRHISKKTDGFETVIAKEFDWVSPTNLAEGLDLLDRYQERASLLGGGTNLVVDMREGKVSPDLVIDLGGLDELKGLDRCNGMMRIGSMVTIQEFVDFEWIGPEKILREAARRLGTPQVRNRATVGGNLAKGSPAADMAVPLLCLDAEVVLLSKAGGKRVLPLQDFFVGPQSTQIASGEILNEVRFETKALGRQWGYRKLGRREGAAVSVVSVGCLVDMDKRRCNQARISLGAVGPTPFRAFEAEALLEGKTLSHEIIHECALLCGSASKPMTDLRASAGYRKRMAMELVRSLLAGVLSSL
jgi:CO/xanthine dehydrogenase FAD-binding subunit